MIGNKMLLITKLVVIENIMSLIVATLALGSWPKQGLAKVQSRVSPGITFHAPRNARECEGMNPHTPKWTPTLGIGIPMHSQIFKGRFQGPKFIGLESSLYHWKDLET
jgi:hypothetical protein